MLMPVRFHAAAPSCARDAAQPEIKIHADDDAVAILPAAVRFRLSLFRRRFPPSNHAVARTAPSAMSPGFLLTPYRAAHTTCCCLLQVRRVRAPVRVEGLSSARRQPSPGQNITAPRLLTSRSSCPGHQGCTS